MKTVWTIVVDCWCGLGQIANNGVQNEASRSRDLAGGIQKIYFTLGPHTSTIQQYKYESRTEEALQSWELIIYHSFPILNAQSHSSTAFSLRPGEGKMQHTSVDFAIVVNDFALHIVRPRAGEHSGW